MELKEIMISMNWFTFRARSLLFENNIVFEQFKRLEEEAYGKGGDVLVLGGGSEEREVEEEKGEAGETEDQLVREEDETILEPGVVGPEGGELLLSPVRKGDPAFAEMEFEGSSHQVSYVGESGDDEASTTPTRTPARKWTVKEAEWYGNHWSYDENAPCGTEGGLHCHAWDGGLGNGEASKMPTRAPPRRWTLKEEEWYANHWSYDGNARDKVCSGEYVLERPPKKPGGTARTCLFLLSIFMAIDSAESKGEGDDTQWSLKIWLGRMVGGIMTVLLCSIILGVTASRKKLYRLWEDVLITNQVVVPLMRAIEAFKARHHIYREEDRHMVPFCSVEEVCRKFP